MGMTRIGGYGPVLGLLALLTNLNCSGKETHRPRGDGPSTGGTESATGGDLVTVGTGGSEVDTGGAGGTGGASTGGSGAVDDPPENGQLDLLLVVDNSISMADKQQMLTQAVPEMVERLVNPLCVSSTGSPAPATGGNCPSGFTREFAPLEDIHIGVITSSLGGHGAPGICARSDVGKYNDDQGRLLAAVRPGLPSSNDSGFLAWNGGDVEAAEQLVLDFTSHLSEVGDNGCGFEAPLEAWYRFLIDPMPPQEIVLDNQRATIVTDDMDNPLIDQVVLAQRGAFLRPQSLVNIVVFTDENDCSVMDGGSYYLNAGLGYLAVSPTFSLRVATAECETNPNDVCCFSCLQATPTGCETAAEVCAGNNTVPAPDNRLNLRCFDQKRRFGLDLLYPTERYVSALRDTEIINARTGELVQNPLLTGAGIHAGILRPEGKVYFTGIVGVPWQDLVTPQSLTQPDTFEYLSAAQLTQTFDLDGEQVTRWDVILGARGLAMSAKRCQEPNPPTECGQTPTPPLDPFMIESMEERPAGAENPISGDVIVAWTSTNPLANAINGHEVNNQIVGTDGPANDDLQYACIFELSTPQVDCTPNDFSCDCGDEPSRNRPLCQPPEGGPASTTQYFGKAYPGIRILEVLRDFGDNSVVSSICPKDPAAGYSATVSAMVNRMKEHFPSAE